MKRFTWCCEKEEDDDKSTIVFVGEKETPDYEIEPSAPSWEEVYGDERTNSTCFQFGIENIPVVHVKSIEDYSQGIIDVSSDSESEDLDDLIGDDEGLFLKILDSKYQIDDLIERAERENWSIAKREELNEMQFTIEEQLDLHLCCMEEFDQKDIIDCISDKIENVNKNVEKGKENVRRGRNCRREKRRVPGCIIC